MKIATTVILSLLLVLVSQAQTTEFVFDPDRTGELTDALPVGEHNGVRGLSGPWDLDRDGQSEFILAQHDAAGGRAHGCIE